MTVPNSTKRGTTRNAAACLLTYLPFTNPAPIQTAAGQAPAQAVLNTAVHGGGQNVYCNQIVIAFPLGAAAGQLFQRTPATSLNTGKWAISSSEVKKAHELWFDDEGNTEYAKFTLDCRDPSDYLINYDLVFGAAGAVTNVASPCTVRVLEKSGTSPDPSTYTPKTGSYDVAVSTPQLYLKNFVATRTGAPTVPATEFASGADVNLAWESNGTFFQIYAKGDPTPVYAGTQTAFRRGGGVKTDTTFVLMAFMSGNPGGGQASFQPIYLFDALTVTVSNPELTPKTSKVSGNATVGGTLGVTGQTTLANAGVAGTLGVGGTLNVTGATGLANASVSGALGVGTNAPLSKLHVIAPGGFGPENSNGTSLPSNVPIVAQSNSTAFGIINGSGRQAFALNIEGDGGTPAARGVPTFCDKYDGTWRASLSLRKGCVGIGTLLPQNALDVKGGAVIGAGYAGSQKAPDNGLSVQGDVNVAANLTVKQNINANNLTVNGNLFSPNSGGVAVNGAMHVTGQFSAFLPIDMFYPPRNAWFRMAIGYSDWAWFDHGPFVSDSSLKEDVRPIPGALDKVMSLRGVLHRWNEKGLHTMTRDVVERVSAGPGATEEQHEAVRQAERQRAVEKLSGDRIGLIAQDVEAALPEAVWENEDGHKCIRYPQLVALLVEAIKEQTAQVRALSGEVSALGERLRDKPM